MPTLSTRDRLTLAAIILLSAALRLYRIDTPLWLDEIYSYRLAQLGFIAIIQNSWQDPHPPLYYLLQWMIASAQCHSELCWRSISIMSGIFTVVIIYLIAQKYTDSFSATVVTLIAATLPSLLFYSQEARPYALLILIASITTLITLQLLTTPLPHLWMWWLIFSIIGFYIGYEYIMAAGTQILVLGTRYYRQREWWIVTISFTISAIILGPMMFSSLYRVRNFHLNTESLNFWHMLKVLLVLEPIRYGWLIAHSLIPVLVIVLGIVVFIDLARNRSFQTAYLLAQFLIPTITFFFVLSPLFHINLPIASTSQFIWLVPTVLIIISQGLHYLLRIHLRIGTIISLVILVFWLGMNMSGLQSYWSNIKSPEGVLVVRLREIRQPDEPVVSLHYSVDFALGFYTNGITVYHSPRSIEQSVQYRQTRSERIFLSDSDLLVTPDDIRSNSPFWVLYLSTSPRLVNPLINGCIIEHEEVAAARQGSFTAIKVRCPNNANP